MELRQPVWLKPEDVPRLPSGWCSMPTEEACIQLTPGKLFDSKTAASSGRVPVLNQSEAGFLGYHDEEPGVVATSDRPVVTFANHTCALRLMKQPFSTIQNIFPKVGRPGVVDTIYFYYAALGRVGLSDYKGHHPLFRKARIPVPPLPVQRRIAGILAAYDELIANSQRRITILESMARALYLEWFVHFRFPGHENHPSVASPLGGIPKGWEVKALGDIAEEVRRNVPKGQLQEATPYVGLEHIPRRSLTLDAWDTVSELGSNKLEFRKGEVLFGKIRPYFHKVSVAPFDGVCSADTIVIRARRPEHYAFVVAQVSSDAFVAEASATANGAKMPRANWDVLRKWPVVLPSGATADAFSALFGHLIGQQQALVFQVKTLRRTRDLLLPRLLSGQIDMEAMPQ
jgi:hypothetical protein